MSSINSLFRLPDEVVLLATLSRSFPCRDSQIRALATLVHPCAAPCRNLALYGTEATGKSAITAALLEAIDEDLELTGHGPEDPSLKFAIANSIECITSRHLFESVVGKVADALKWDRPPSKCETLSQLTVELSKMLKYTPRPVGFRFVLVFDGIDRQREAPPTLLPALARLSEIIPCLTTVFIVTSPPANFLRTPFVAYIHFPNYTKAEFVAILATQPPQPLPSATKEETVDLWARFTGAVHDALARAASRTLPAFRHACMALWPRFTAPILAGTHAPREFSKLLVAARVHFQDEKLLDPGMVALHSNKSNITTGTNNTPNTGPAHQAAAAAAAAVNGPTPKPPTTTITKRDQPKSLAAATATATATTAAPDLASLLPTTARLLLLASYLASHNPTRHDLTLFSTHHHGRRRRRGGLSVGGGGAGRGARTKHRKIARKLLGAHAFVLERMLAIFAAVRREWDAKSTATISNPTSGEAALDSDIEMAIATLASLRLLVRVGGGASAGADPMDRGGKWRVNVGWEVVRGLGRSIGVEVEDWLIE
ncbi:origin recognition complex subunit 5 C-terminus-domain-containing protein [Bombardia bombarda]|uniref:Origin recognition complex subunit 5 C-terminus-domain-containing protein n=1 Tax=Bombardia bombarda TaxID=252184 RepID=A0AA39XIT3_9PEZI|nr:origin recognition complex subunit 5 C-terminus-domain-containing protein [Bombardia bombarda]